MQINCPGYKGINIYPSNIILMMLGVGCSGKEVVNYSNGVACL